MGGSDRPKKLEILIESEDGEQYEPLVLLGTYIEFGRVACQIRKKRKEYSGKYGRSMRIRQLRYFEKREVPESEYEGEVLGLTPFTNTKIEYVLSEEEMPLVSRRELRKALKKNLNLKIMRDSKGIKINDIENEITRLYPYNEWKGYTTLDGALKILFVRYKNYLKR